MNMSEITKNAFKGYGFQLEVARMFCFLMEFYPNEFVYLRCEIGDEVDHNFDDISLKSKNKSYFIQVKNYSSKNEKAVYEDGYIIYCDHKIKLSQNDVNVFVCNSVYCDSENEQKNFYGLRTTYVEEGNVYILYLSPDYIDSFKNSNCVNDSRRKQLDSFFISKLLNSETIRNSDLPLFELYSNDLMEQTIKVRDFVEKPDENVLFIVAPPGYGKSHFVNEIELPKKIIYRFWISQVDNNHMDRLKYDRFLEQLSYCVDKDNHCKKDLKTIIEMLAYNGQTLIVDGLDHIFTYNQLEIDKYINFIKECSKIKSINLIVLTRPLSNDFYIKYKTFFLQNWTKEECFVYCKYFKINKEDQDKIYSISQGYPIIVHYLCEEYLKNKGHLSVEGKIDGLDDYYKKILSLGNFDSNLKRLRLIATITPFIHTHDLEVLYDSVVINQLEALLIDYPHLVSYKNKRVYFYHESVYQYILSNTDPSYFEAIHDKVFRSLLSGDVTFMSRASFSFFNKKQKKQLIKKYSNIDFFKNLFNKTYDFESIKAFYAKIMDELCNYKNSPINVFDIYNLVTILLLLSRNYYEDNNNLIFHLYTQLRNNNEEWGEHVFSSGALFNTFTEIESFPCCKNEPNNIYVLDNGNISIEQTIEQESNFFNVLVYDFRKATAGYLDSNKTYPDSNAFAEYLVSGYIHETESVCKTIIDEYESGYDNYYIARKVLNSFSFIDYKLDTFPITFAVSKALDRLRCLGIKSGVVEYDNVRDFLLSHKDLKTFDFYNDLNGYIRYSNKINRKLNLCEISPYLLMMDAHKDATISYAPEAMALYVKHGVFTITECYKYLSKIYSLIDDGNRWAATNFINELGPTYYDELVTNNFFDTDSFYIFYSSLSVNMLNKIPFNYVLNYVTKYYLRYPQSRSYVTDDELGNLLKCKHMKKIRTILNIDDIEIKYSSKDKSNKRRFTKKQLEKDWYYREGCLDLYKEYGFSIEQMAKLYDGWGYKLFDPRIFSIFENDVIYSNIEKIIFIGFTEKKEIFYKYFQYNATLLYTIPLFYHLYDKEFNYKKTGNIFRKMLATILRV